MRNLISAAATFAAISMLIYPPAEAQVAESGYTLPLSLAIDAATEAIRSCAAHGYAVSASVVDTSGVVKLQAKGDHSTIHTQDSSFRKAYTVVTFAPIFNLDTSSQIAELAKNPDGPGPALTALPNVLALAGAVAIKHNGEIVAALGVGGSPGGAKDEVCAEAGIAKIRDRLDAIRRVHADIGNSRPNGSEVNRMKARNPTEMMPGTPSTRAANASGS
jgi:uncharacterized protein GlcG (DUF336 family)